MVAAPDVAPASGAAPGRQRRRERRGRLGRRDGAPAAGAARATMPVARWRGHPGGSNRLGRQVPRSPRAAAAPRPRPGVPRRGSLRRCPPWTRPTCAGRARSSASGACARRSPGRPAASTTFPRASGGCSLCGPAWASSRPGRGPASPTARHQRQARRATRGHRPAPTADAPGRGACTVGTSTTVTSADVATSTDAFATQPAPTRSPRRPGRWCLRRAARAVSPPRVASIPRDRRRQRRPRRHPEQPSARGEQSGWHRPDAAADPARDGGPGVCGRERALKRDLARSRPPEPEPESCSTAGTNPSWTDPRPGIDD